MTNARLAVILLLLGTPAVHAYSAAQPDTDPAGLRNTMWQPLSEDVTTVYVGPGGRLWRCSEPLRMPLELSELRAQVEREFAKRSPMITELRPILFEPGGRVWFIRYTHDPLMAYDGSRWIEHEVPREQAVIGACPRHGRSAERGWNLVLGSRVFFSARHGVHCFDGRNWSYTPLDDPRAKPQSDDWSPRLCVEPDGKSLLAVVQGQTVIWRWRDGRWSKIPHGSTDIGRIAPWRDGAVVSDGYGPVRFLRFGSRPDIRLGYLVRKLKSARTEDERQRIAEQIAGYGFIARSIVLGMKSLSDDPGWAKQLDQIAGSAWKHTSLTLGSLQIEKASWLHADELGRFYLAGSHITRQGRTIESGLIIGYPDGTARVLEGEEFTAGWTSPYGDRCPMLTSDGKGIWTLGLDGVGPGRLLDLTSGKFVDALPDSRLHWLHTVASDGTVFVSNRGPGGMDSTVMAYRSKSPDERRLLEETRIKVGGEHVGVVGIDSVGAIWAPGLDHEVMRFDGKQWNKVFVAPDNRDVAFFLPGRNGEMLVRFDYGLYTLVTGTDTYNDPDIHILIDRYSDVIRSSFTCDAPDAGGSITRLAVDKDGNYWVLQGNKLSVRVGDRWVDAQESLRRVGSRQGFVYYMECLHDGTIYLSDLLPSYDGGRSFHGHVTDGQLVFSPAPHSVQEHLVSPGTRDQQGGLWLVGDHFGRSSPDGSHSQIALRLAGDGDVQEVIGKGWATLCDKSGNVWLGQHWGSPETFSIWRNGELVSSVHVPMANEFSKLVSDAPGFVYVWTSTGICHMVAKADDPAAYRLEGVYYPMGIAGELSGVAYSELGYLVVSTYMHFGASEPSVYLFPLPKPLRQDVVR